MRTLRSLLLIVAASLWLFACNSATKSDAEQVDENPAMAEEWVEIVLNVDGMTCDGCENAIKAGVENLNGIASVESSHEEGWTRVKYDKNQTSLGDIEAKITETGYEVKGDQGTL